MLREIVFSIILAMNIIPDSSWECSYQEAEERISVVCISEDTNDWIHGWISKDENKIEISRGKGL